MTDSNNKNKTSIGSVLVGAAIGAAAVTLMNKNSRKKLKENINKALETGDRKLDELQKKAEEVKKNVQEKAEDAKKNVQAKAADAKNNFKVKAVKELNKTQRKIAETV